ncbi:MAG: Holliday junction resolvase RuvX [Planctomycetes bacterium]|jgi:putative Holliday junction resolvase|nr:Holliday junction resolvase RuvX [Planctomycetota bacterium]MCP4837867.1 Holliday junction resolvase RuvX [Planctomycetota bacterium]
MRLLAVDLGDKRTGLAVGDTETRSVFPITTLHVPRGDALLAEVVKAIREHGADAIVVGLPLNMDGTEGPRAKLTRDFGDQLAERVQVPVHYQDERLTSFEAEYRTRGQQVPRGTDAHAAAVLLEEHLDAL